MFDGWVCNPQVAFKSDYLKLYTSQQVAVSALLSTKEALAEVCGAVNAGIDPNSMNTRSCASAVVILG